MVKWRTGQGEEIEVQDLKDAHLRSIVRLLRREMPDEAVRVLERQDREEERGEDPVFNLDLEAAESESYAGSDFDYEELRDAIIGDDVNKICALLKPDTWPALLAELQKRGLTA